MSYARGGGPATAAEIDALVVAEAQAAQPLPVIDYDEIDPGVRRLVRLLRDAGFDTCDSGDGHAKFADMSDADIVENADARAPGSFGLMLGCAEPVPNVYMRVERDRMVAEVERLRDLIAERTRVGIYEEIMVVNEQEGPRVQIQAIYSPIDGCATLSLHGISDADLGPDRLTTAAKP